jgi:hypothetical protein
MSALREAAEMALKALEEINKLSVGEKAICLPGEIDDTMEALRQALEQPEQEPVAFVNGYFGGYLTITCFDPTLVLPDGLVLYTAPPKREWVGLTKEEMLDCWRQAHEPGNREYVNAMNMARAVLDKAKEKNT